METFLFSVPSPSETVEKWKKIGLKAINKKWSNQTNHKSNTHTHTDKKIVVEMVRASLSGKKKRNKSKRNKFI